MKGDPEFVILKYQAWMDAEPFEPKILGAIVKEPLKPTTNYVSPQRQYNKEDLQEGSVKDFVLDNSVKDSKEATAKLQSLGGFNFKGEISNAILLKGKFIRFKRLQQVDDFWKLLKQDEKVKAKVPGWISIFNNWPPCLVVGIMICEDVELSYSGESSRTIDGNVEVPVGAITLAAGVPNPLGNAGDPELSMGGTHKQANLFKAKMGESKIFAIEVQTITTPILKLKQLKLLNVGPKFDDVRRAGPDSEDDEDDEEEPVVEDLILDRLTPRELEMITG